MQICSYYIGEAANVFASKNFRLMFFRSRFFSTLNAVHTYKHCELL